MTCEALARAVVKRFPSTFLLRTAPLLACALAACGGGGGGGGVPGGSVLSGAFRPKPGGGHYFEDAHSGGGSSRLALVETQWGRLVDVNEVDADGNTLDEPVLRDFVIGENALDAPGDYTLETSPISQQGAPGGAARARRARHGSRHLRGAPAARRRRPPASSRKRRGDRQPSLLHGARNGS